MACFNGRVPLEIMDKIMDLLDGRSLLDFEQTSKPNQVHVNEAFERRKHLELSECLQLANKLLLRCGPQLSTIDHPCYPDYRAYGAYFDKLTKLGQAASSLE